MNKIHKILLCAALSLTAAVVTGCNSDDGSRSIVGGDSNSDGGDSGNIGIEGITFENYPRVDGSTSTDPLNMTILCKLLGWTYRWEYAGSWTILIDTPDGIFMGSLGTICPPSGSCIREKVKSSQTHGSIINLIENKTDIIISARKMSEDEKSHADSLGVSLIETPIALDALVFLLNKENTVNSLSVEQIQGIYLGEITNWNELGGEDNEIKPFIRNPNSGSQEMMKEIVMNGINMADWDKGYNDELTVWVMSQVYQELRTNSNGICFTPHYYKEYIVRGRDAGNTKSVAIDGILPSSETIRDKTYPLIAEVYVSIRSDLDRNTMAYKMYEWLQTQAGKEVIAESGYVPN